jgi:hypothetical protein
MNANHPGDRPDPSDSLAAVLGGIRSATDAIAPPSDFAARVMARTARVRPVPTLRDARERPSTAWWADLGPVGRRFVPVAAMAAAAAFALAWSAQDGLDDTAPSALELAQSLP